MYSFINSIIKSAAVIVSISALSYNSLFPSFTYANNKTPELLWSSIFVTLVAKKYLAPATPPLLHVE